MAQQAQTLSTDLQDGIERLKAVFVKKEEVAKAQKDLMDMQNAVGLWGYGDDVYMPYRIERALTSIFQNESLSKEAYQSMLAENIDMAKHYFYHYYSNYTYRNENKNQRAAAFSCVIGQAEVIWELIHKECFNPSELKTIYDVHSKTFFKKIGRGVLDLYEYCRIFKAYTSEVEKDLLVKRIIGRKKTDLAKRIIAEANQWNLTAEQQGQLDGLLVAEKLRKAR